MHLHYIWIDNCLIDLNPEVRVSRKCCSRKGRYITLHTLHITGRGDVHYTENHLFCDCLFSLSCAHQHQLHGQQLSCS